MRLCSWWCGAARPSGKCTLDGYLRPYDLTLLFERPQSRCVEALSMVERVLFVMSGIYASSTLSMVELSCLLSSRCSLWLELTVRANGDWSFLERMVNGWVSKILDVWKREFVSFLFIFVWISSHCANVSLDYERWGTRCNLFKRVPKSQCGPRDQIVNLYQRLFLWFWSFLNNLLQFNLFYNQRPVTAYTRIPRFQTWESVHGAIQRSETTIAQL